MTITTRTHAAPWTFRRVLTMFTPTTPRRRAAAPWIDHVLTGREAAARHLFGEAVRWDPIDMLEYDTDSRLRGGWLAEADRRIAAAKSPDRHVAAHHGYTAEAWAGLSSLAKVDLREQFNADKGLAA